MSELAGDDLLIDLFREEVRTNSQVLTEGLVALEQGSTSPDRLEAMMRAAHSIKGAARVVNVQPGVEVAHAMEDCLVRAQNTQLSLTSAIVDVLLACVDMLQAIGEAAGAGFAAWLEGYQSEVAQLVQRLDSALREGKTEASPGPSAPENASSSSMTRSRCGKWSGSSWRTKAIWSRSPWTGWKDGTWCARGTSTW